LPQGPASWRQGPAIKVTGQWTANLPAVSRSGGGGYAVLTGGKAAGDFAASLDSKKEIQAKFAVTALAADPKLVTGTLPAVSATCGPTSTRTAGSPSRPAALEREGRKSDLTLAGSSRRPPPDSRSTAASRAPTSRGGCADSRRAWPESRRRRRRPTTTATAPARDTARLGRPGAGSWP